MTDVQDLIARNAAFAADTFQPGLRINPRGNLMVVGCVDPRVDPSDVVGLEHGEAAVLRNVGGRITPATLRTMALLGKVGAAHAAGRYDGVWNLVILHHTDCGMHDIAPFPALLAEYFEVPEEELDAKHVTDPMASVRTDVEVILATNRGPDFLVSGLVYDVETGTVEMVVPPTPLDLA